MKQQVRADLCFPVRLDGLAEKWGRHVLYDPDVTSAATMYLKRPRCCIQVWASGKLKAFVENVDSGKEAIQRVYALLQEFSR